MLSSDNPRLLQTSQLVKKKNNTQKNKPAISVKCNKAKCNKTRYSYRIKYNNIAGMISNYPVSLGDFSPDYLGASSPQDHHPI